MYRLRGPIVIWDRDSGRLESDVRPGQANLCELEPIAQLASATESADVKNCRHESQRTEHHGDLLTTNMDGVYSVGSQQKEAPVMPVDRFDVLHGSLALMILRTLDTLGPLHGYGIARRIEQISEHQFALNQGTLYPALLKLEQLGWITSSWGSSDNNRRARFYAISRAGQKQLKAEAKKWSKTSQIVARFINPTEDLA
jgi:PadR family transcriptional regulator PadR